MQRFVIDTSVLVSYFIDNPLTEKVNQLISLAVSVKVKLYAPQLIWFEFYSVIIQNSQSKTEVLAVFEIFEAFIEKGVIEIVEDVEVLDTALNLAFSKATGKQGYIAPFDAYFHGLALELGYPFITSDEKHYNKTRDSFGNIILFKNWELPA